MKPLKRIYIEITNICNMSCSFCPRTQRANRSMTTEEFRAIIAQAAPLTNHVYLHVKGEPLLHSDLDCLLSICQEWNLQVNLTTNGTLLQKKKESLIHAPALRQLNISLHSFEAGDKNISSFESYIDSILSISRELQDKTKTIIALRLWNLNKENITESLKMQNQYILQRLEAEFPSNPSITDQFLGHFSTSDQGTIIPRGIKLASGIYLNQSYEFVWPSLNVPLIGDSGYCHGLKDQVAILADGTVVPCCLDGEGVINLGNVHDQPLSELLTSPRANAIRNGFACRRAVESLCKHCGYRERFGS